jgi:hypothetical protein
MSLWKKALDGVISSGVVGCEVLEPTTIIRILLFPKWGMPNA